MVLRFEQFSVSSTRSCIRDVSRGENGEEKGEEGWWVCDEHFQGMFMLEARNGGSAERSISHFVISYNGERVSITSVNSCIRDASKRKSGN